MTINWYKPSQCILILVTASSLLVFLGCLACGFLLHFAPEEPKPSGSEELNGGIYTSIPTIALLCAAVLTAVALLLGCYGACRDSKLFLFLFASVTFIVAVVILGSSTSVFAFSMHGEIRSKLSSVLIEELDNYSEKHPVWEDNIFGRIQTDYKCCGSESYKDWENSTWWSEREEGSQARAPSSCCIHNSTNCSQYIDNLYKQGCLSVLLERLKLVVYVVFGFCVVLGLLEVVTALSACYGARLIQRYQSYDVL